MLAQVGRSWFNPYMARGKTVQDLGNTRRRVLELAEKGLKGAEIARVLGLKHQGIYAHLQALRKSGHLNGQKP